MSDLFDYDDEVGNQPGPIVSNGRRLSWWECLDLMRAETVQARQWQEMVADLDRSPHGRHEGDAEGQDPSGISQGNPFIREHATLGYDISGRPYRMPERSRRHDIDAWKAGGTE